MHCQVWPDNT